MPAPREDPRLKAAGLALLLLAGLWLAQLARQAPRWFEAGAQEAAATPSTLGLLVQTVLSVNLLALGLAVLVRGCGHALGGTGPRRRGTLLLGWLIVNLAVPPALFGLLDGEGQATRWLQQAGWEPGLDLGGALLAWVAWRLWQRSRRMAAPDAAQALRDDPRPPVLYLRSFADDGVAVLDDNGFQSFARLMAWIGPPSPEQETATVLQQVGPMVGIGQPGEDLPVLGAARLYVGDDAWQAAVLALMQQARLVVIRVGASPGVRWEIEQALARVPRERLVLAFFASAGPTVAPALRERLAPVLGAAWDEAQPVPPPRGWRAWGLRDPRRRIGSLVCFPGGGPAQVVALRMWPLWGRDVLALAVMRLSALPLRRGWRSVLQRLGADAGRFTAPKSRAVAVLLAAFTGGFGGHWFYLGRRRRAWAYAALLFAGSFLAGLWDALQFLWMDRARFDARFGGPPLSSRVSTTTGGTGDQHL